MDRLLRVVSGHQTENIKESTTRLPRCSRSGMVGGKKQRRGAGGCIGGNREAGGSGRTVVVAGIVVGMSKGKEEGEEEYEGETTSIVASLVSEHSESGAQALAPAPVQPGGEELGGFRRLGLGREPSGIPILNSLFSTK